MSMTRTAIPGLKIALFSRKHGMASEAPLATGRIAKGDNQSDYGPDLDQELLEAVVLEKADARSDYGSELDSDGEQILVDLLTELEGVSVKPLVLESLEEDDTARGLVHVPKFSSQESNKTSSTQYYSSLEDQVVTEAEFDGGYRATHATLAREASLPTVEQDVPVEIQRAEERDTRSPLERFRKAPKKPLSVTDIVSPAWCELQYWYTLTKHGRKKRTPAMKQGTKVHKELEAQVHEIVPIDVQTREDGWALRIWNIIQGLRTLRATGMTRELETWGVIDGQVINGIIDELSFTCPDPELESALEETKEAAKAPLPPNQKTLTAFYASHSQVTGAWLSDSHPIRKIYVTDIKTRSSKYLPRGSSLKPTQMQLMLYHRLLVELAMNTVPADTIFERYHLNSKAPFTKRFIAAVAELEDNFIPDADSDANHAAFNTRDDSVFELLQHNSLTQLWSLMISEFQRTIPSADAVGSVLQAEFRNQSDGTVLGSKTFAYDNEMLQTYIDDEMMWWKGEREPRGVDVEEAFKCRICEFAEGCEWREKKVEEATEKFRKRRTSIKRSIV